MFIFQRNCILRNTTRLHQLGDRKAQQPRSNVATPAEAHCGSPRPHKDLSISNFLSRSCTAIHVPQVQRYTWSFAVACTWHERSHRSHTFSWIFVNWSYMFLTCACAVHPSLRGLVWVRYGSLSRKVRSDTCLAFVWQLVSFMIFILGLREIISRNKTWTTEMPL